jgi:hypothetical protein
MLGNPGTDGTFPGFRRHEIGEHPVCPRFIPVHSGDWQLDNLLQQ